MNELIKILRNIGFVKNYDIQLLYDYSFSKSGNRYLIYLSDIWIIITVYNGTYKSNRFDFDDDGINKTIIFIKNIDNFKSHFRKDKIDKLLNG